jgi:tetratricopeptide (TPR) repeat protein
VSVHEGKVQVAKGLQFRGRVAEAEALYREILRDEPDTAGALEGLGVLVFQQGRAAEAADLFGRAVAICPESARFHANLGEALRSTGRVENAIAHLRRATELDPKLPHAWNSLALLAQSQGRSADAEASCREAIRLAPRLTAAYINLGNALCSLGRPAEAAAALREALQIEPHNYVALMNLGSALCDLNDRALLSEAESLCRRAVALAPQVSQGHQILGRALRMQGRDDEARACFERALGRSPSRAARDQPEAATGPSAALARQLEGIAALQQGKLDEAERCLLEALQLDPKLAAAWNAMARIHAERGDFDQSCQASRNAIASHPRQAEAYWRLATSLKGRLPDHEVEAMQDLIKDETLSVDDRALLRFGLAAVMERQGLFETAAQQLAAAHVNHSAGKAARGLTCDPAAHTRLIERTIATYTADFVAQRKSWGLPDPRPVFVVGLPRSGTTLTEQIIASHPLAFGAGELLDVQRVASSIPELVGQPSLDAFAAVRALEPASAQVAAKMYLDRLEKLAPQSSVRVVDKNPENDQFLGLIAILWPAARVILCRRDPRDVAVSCWRTNLPTTPWSSDWNHLAQVFADEQRLIEHWRNSQPVEWLGLDYESLVGDPEGQSRRLIDFLGLPWNPACLSFHENRRVVRTPSLVQVRQPVYADSVGIWRKYEPYLAPLFQAFERHGVKVP